MTLSHSRMNPVRFYLDETQLSWLDGHNHALNFLGGWLKTDRQAIDNEIRALQLGSAARLRLTTSCTDYTGGLTIEEEHVIAGSASFDFHVNPTRCADDFDVQVMAVTFRGTHVPKWG